MNRPELFVKSVDILVDAYKKGKLINGNACNCAVGNLIAYRKGTYAFSADWMKVVTGIRNLGLYRKRNEIEPKDLSRSKELYGGDYYENIHVRDGVENGFAEIKETEYTSIEIEKIERAFENQGIREEDSSDSRPGLLRAIRVLGNIHDIPKETVECMRDKVKKETYKFSHKFRTRRKNVYDESKVCPVVCTLK